MASTNDDMLQIDRHSAVDHLRVELTKGQQRVVYSDRRDHFLVIAPPGSGKTLTITRRIAHLLSDGHKVDPDEIMALTFTERAANELVTRLSAMVRPGVYAGTFHSACLRLLREHATSTIGAKVPIVLSDAERRRMVKDAADHAGHRIDNYNVKELLGALSRVKCSNLPIEEAVGGFRPGPEVAQTILEIYQQWLREEGACDFDDLIIETADLMWNDPEAAQRVHNRYRFIFVDEYQDVSSEQYRLIRSLIPPESQERQLLVVADANQAIFGFRGAMPDRMLGQLHEDYRPVRFDLNENHRSTGHIVTMAQRLMHVVGAEEVSIGVRPEGMVVDWFEEPNDVYEARLVARLVERAIQKGRKPSEIAILYRRHRRADLVEQALADRAIPVKRLQPDRFFDDPETQETIRYFELVSATHDKSLSSALNWPRFLVDELTMIDLRRIADRHELTLGELAESPPVLRAEATPLTATQIIKFMRDVVFPARESAETGAVESVDRMLALLSSRRDPIPLGQRANFRSTLDEVGRLLGPSAEKFEQALAGHRSVVLEVEQHQDCFLAAALVQKTLEEYFPGNTVGDPFVLSLGETGRDFDICLTWSDSTRVTVTCQAWRLMQMVLMRFEKLYFNEFTVFDLETTSVVPLTAEMMEIAGVKVVHGSVDQESFSTRVRPSSPEAITLGAQNVHGITWEMVKVCPPVDEVLPSFLEFVSDSIIAGHNIVSFDSRILARECERLGLNSPTRFQLDTLRLARRLRPKQSNALDDLLTDEERKARGKHAALGDASLSGKVLLRLLEEMTRDREIDVLSESLPLVGASIMFREAEGTPDNDLLVRAAARRFLFNPDWNLPESKCGGQDWNLLESAGSWLEHRFAAEADDERWTNLENNWKAFVDGFARIRGEISLAELLERVSLATVSDLDGGDRDRVTMMTVYSAKGHEWPVVFMIGSEDGEYPYSNPLDPAEELREARRAFYVGITRTMERLLLTSAWTVNHNPRSPSPFIADIRDLIAHHPPKVKVPEA